MSSPFAPADFLDLAQTEHAALFDGVLHAWEVLPRLKDYLEKELKPENRGKLIGHPAIGERVFIGENTRIEPGAYIKGPAWIGANCEIRHGAYLRENVDRGRGVGDREFKRDQEQHSFPEVPSAAFQLRG